MNDSINPFTVTVPYVYRPFPRMLHKAGGQTCVVDTQDACDVAMAAGWSRLPVVPDDPVPIMVMPSEPAKRGPGRPKKESE